MRTLSQICVFFVDLEKGLRVLWVAGRNRFTGSYFSKNVCLLRSMRHGEPRNCPLRRSGHGLSPVPSGESSGGKSKKD